MSHGFNPGTAAYEIVADANTATLRFETSGGTRSSDAYFDPVIEVSNFYAADGDVTVERSTDGGATFAPLPASAYNLTTQADEAQVGGGRRVLQYLGTIPASATGASAWAFRLSAPVGPTPSPSPSPTPSPSPSPTPSPSPAPPPCPPAPDGSCIEAARATFLSNEKSPGREKLKLSLKKIVDLVGTSDLGNPATGASGYHTCLYDEADTLVAVLEVDQAGEFCGTNPKPCWKFIGGGYKYSDSEAAADGVVKITARGGIPTKGAIKLIAKNNFGKGQLALPTNIPDALAASGSVTAQVRVDDGACFGATLTTSQSTPTVFKAKK